MTASAARASPPDAPLLAVADLSIAFPSPLGPRRVVDRLVAFANHTHTTVPEILQLFDAGVSYAEVVRLALGTEVFRNLTGDGSNESLVNVLYRNVMGSAPSVADIQYFAGLIANGTFTRESLAVTACQFTLNADSVDLVGLVATGIEYTPQG